MPAVSQSQGRFFAMCEHMDHPASRCPKMSKAKMHDYSSTPRKGLPKHVKMPTLSKALLG